MNSDGQDFSAFDQKPRDSARVKVLNPLTSLGPAMHAKLLSSSDNDLEVRVPRSILIGSAVQVRTSEQIVFGEVQSCEPTGAEFEIGVTVVIRRLPRADAQM